MTKTTILNMEAYRFYGQIDWDNGGYKYDTNKVITVRAHKTIERYYIVKDNDTDKIIDKYEKADDAYARAIYCAPIGKTYKVEHITNEFISWH
jgi:hypothetical protein